MLESYSVKIKNDKVLEILKKLLCAVDESYNKTKFLNLLNYKHLLMTSAQVMELTEKEQNTLLHSFLLWESEVVFMGFILFLIYALGFSLTINVALLTIIYIIWTNKE